MVTLANPKKALIQRFYDIGSPYYAEIFGQHIHDGYYLTGKESRAEAGENLIKYLVEKARISAGAKILDVGCGIGGSSVWLANNIGAKTVGITISPGQVEMAHASSVRNHADSAFYLMDAEKMEFDSAFDVIWAVAVCTHLENQPEFIQRATRFLNQKGSFIIFDWMLASGAKRFRDDVSVKSVRRGMLLQSMHTLAEYQAWFAASGYDVLHVEDITPFTIKTWDDAISMAQQPAVWKLAYQLAVKEGKEVFAFLRSLNSMKTAMEKGKIIAGAIIARKN